MWRTLGPIRKLPGRSIQTSGPIDLSVRRALYAAQLASAAFRHCAAMSSSRSGSFRSLRSSLLWPPGCHAGTLMSLNQLADSHRIAHKR